MTKGAIATDYYLRIEEHYRNDKIILEIERFHSKNSNGIQQEINAAA
ncbi:MAG TPA: hypothetical protein VHO70_20260 [Chitinispirillaceae bacterium]|nr:hypothetical protein [Chitinispirillaceae bacterium]